MAGRHRQAREAGEQGKPEPHRVKPPGSHSFTQFRDVPPEIERPQYIP
jgi:hypothetical protein